MQRTDEQGEEAPPAIQRKEQGVGYRKGNKFTVKAWKGHPTYRWRVHYIEGGKHRGKGFKKKKEAESWAEEKEAKALAEGTETSLTHAERSAVIDTREQLAEMGVDLRSAVEYAVKQLRLARKSCSVAELVERSIADRERAGRSKRYLQDMRSRLGRFQLSFGDRAVATVETDEISDWLHGLELAPVTTNNFRRLLVVMFNDAVDAGYIERNPAEKVRRVKEVEYEVDVLSPAELGALLEKADTRILPYLAIGAFAGVRREEVEGQDGPGLDWANIDFAEGHIRVRASSAKSSRNRLIPISDNLAEWLRPHAEKSGKIWPKGGSRLLRRAHRAAGLGEPGSETDEEKGAGIEMVRPWPDNALRHSFASYWLAHHQKADELALHMGHRGTSLIFSNYRAVVTPAAAEKYWSIMPEEASNVVEMAS